MDHTPKTHLATARSLVFQMRLEPSSADFDDLIQEGAIAAWLATKDRDLRDPTTYGMVAARRRIQRSLTGRLPMYGSEAPKGQRIHDQMRKTDCREVVEEGFAESRSTAPDPLDGVLAREGLESLLDRLERPEDRRLAAMLSLGWNFKEIAEDLGIKHSAAHHRWTKRIRPALREAAA